MKKRLRQLEFEFVRRNLHIPEKYGYIHMGYVPLGGSFQTLQFADAIDTFRADIIDAQIYLFHIADKNFFHDFANNYYYIKYAHLEAYDENHIFNAWDVSFVGMDDERCNRHRARVSRKSPDDVRGDFHHELVLSETLIPNETLRNELGKSVLMQLEQIKKFAGYQT